MAIAVTQDHPHRVFENLLKDHLTRLDVAEVSVIWSRSGDNPGRAARQDGRLHADILIVGEMTCNGYAEVYYQAEFSCYTARETVCTLMERPPGGDRPENLAIEIVTKLSTKLEDLIRRNERRRAIGELQAQTKSKTPCRIKNGIMILQGV